MWGGEGRDVDGHLQIFTKPETKKSYAGSKQIYAACLVSLSYNPPEIILGINKLPEDGLKK